MQLSANTRYLLAQHLHWVNNGYDIIKLKTVISTIRYKNPFVPARLEQIVEITGKPSNNDFNLEELDELTYLYPNLMFGFDGNLSFLKYCINIVEVDFSGLNLVDISDLKHLKNLTEIDLSCTNINSIDSLSTLVNIEVLNLQNCNTVSLAPLLDQRKIKKIVLDNVEKEKDILDIISTQEVISAEYLVKNTKLLKGLSFPKYLVCINLEKEKLSISMTSIVSDRYSQFCTIPSEMIEDKSFIEAYSELLETELDSRVESILKTNYDIIETFKYYTNEEVEFGLEMKIKIK